MTGISKPVELLRDGRGIYGIGVSAGFDLEALAWACGIDDPDVFSRPRDLILRTDLLREPAWYGRYCHSAVLQQITGGFRHGLFANSREEYLRQVVHHRAPCGTPTERR